VALGWPEHTRSWRRRVCPRSCTRRRLLVSVVEAPYPPSSWREEGDVGVGVGELPRGGGEDAGARGEQAVVGSPGSPGSGRVSPPRVSTSAPGVEAIWASCCRSRVSCGCHPVIAAAASSAFGCAVRAQSRQVNGGVRQEKALSACRRASRLCRASAGLRRPWRPGTRTGRCAATSAAAGLSEYLVPWWRSGSRSPLALSLVVVGGSVADCRVGRPHQRIGLETGRPQCGEWSARCPGLAVAGSRVDDGCLSRRCVTEVGPRRGCRGGGCSPDDRR